MIPIKNIHTVVVSVDGNKVLFAETIADSFAGGQESDKAWVNAIPIIDSVREDNLISRRQSHLLYAT